LTKLYYFNIINIYFLRSIQ